MRAQYGAASTRTFEEETVKAWGTGLDHENEELVFDPSRGIIPVDGLFESSGLQTYSGTLGMTSFTYQPGQPIQTWSKTEHGYVPPSQT